MTKELAIIMQKLRWSAEGGEWSAYMKPEECKILMQYIQSAERVKSALGHYYRADVRVDL